MVALLVVLTILLCLLADGILVTVRERNKVGVKERDLMGTENMVFAQDGGEPTKVRADKERNISWEEVVESRSDANKENRQGREVASRQ